MGNYGEDGDTIKTEAGDISLKDIIDATEIGNTGNGGSSTGENDGNTDISQLIEKVQSLEEKVIQLENGNKQMYPIGSIYISTEATNPAELFGGTWESYGQGRTLVGVGTSDQTFVAGQTGGESNHTLTIAEMPYHTHELAMAEAAGGTPGPGYGLNGGFAYPSATSIWAGSYTSAVGNSMSHNNLQPYIVTYMWKRVS